LFRVIKAQFLARNEVSVVVSNRISFNHTVQFRKKKSFNLNRF